MACANTPLTVRVAAKELTALILDEDRLRAERSDRRSWKSRVTGLEEYAPQFASDSLAPPRSRERRNFSDEEDAEYRLAIEASKHQEEEDRKKRENRRDDDDDDDLAKAIKLSKEEEERRRRELEDSNATSLFGEESTQPQYTGFNQGYQQGNPVDFFANPIDQSQMQTQPTGYMAGSYTGLQPNYNTLNMPTGSALDPYGQQQNVQPFQSQLTGYNPYASMPQQQSPLVHPSVPQPEPTLPPGSNNPWSSNKNQPQSLMVTPTGSNNPFAQFNRTQVSTKTAAPVLGSLPEQQPLSSFNQVQQPPPPQQQQQTFSAAQKPLNEYESKLNALLATGDGMDTFGNTGDLRIPAQHTAPGTFVNSAGSGMQRLNPETTGNPFMRQQFTGMPSISYGSQGPNATGPASMQGQGGNPFGAQQAQKQPPNQDLIQF